MNWKIYMDRYFPLIYKMANLNHTPVSRRTAANIIASTINEAARKDVVTDDILHPFLSLCQDNDMDIGKNMVRNCSILVPRLNKVLVKQVHAELMIILKERSSILRMITIEVMVSSYRFFRTEQVIDFLPLLFKEINGCTEFSNNWILMNFGAVVKLLFSLKIFNKDYSESLHCFLHKAVTSEETGARVAAVRCIHHLADLQLSRGIDMKFDSEINKRVHDPLYLPHIASVFPEILLAFSKHKKALSLRPCFIAVLMNISKELYDIVIPYLPEILTKLMPDPVCREQKGELQSEETSFREAIMMQVKRIWKAKGTPWRSLIVFIESVWKTQAHFPLELYNHYFLDEFLIALKTSNSEVQKILLQAICRLLVCSHSASKREEVLGKLVALSSSKSFYERRQFLAFCSLAVENFAQSVTARVELLKHYLKLAVDRVANVRLGFLSCAVTVWKHTPVESRNDILEAVESLRQDEDREVSSMGSSISTYMKTHGAIILKDDALRRKENEYRENVEKALVEREREAQEEKKKLNQPSIFKIKSVRKKSLNTIVVRYRKGLTINQNLVNANSIGTRNRTNRSNISFHENKSRLLKLPSFGQAETKVGNIKIRRVQYSPEKAKSRLKESKFRK